MLYVRNRRHLAFFETHHGLDERQLRYLKGTIYHFFRHHILPKLPVTNFKKFFSMHQGRPTKDIQSMIGLFIIQAILNLADHEAVEAYNFHYNLRYALDLRKGDYISQRTYYYYRKILLGEAYDVFYTMLEKIVADLSLDLSIQRTDSTIVTTNLKKMSKLELLRTTLTKFLADLQKKHKIIFSRLNDQFKDYLQKKNNNAWFASPKPDRYSELLIQVAEDIIILINKFKDHRTVNKLESFALLVRVAQEQITVENQKIKVELTLKKKGAALVNPNDPDAQYNGHYKKTGYKVNLSETCSKSKDKPNPKLITQVEVTKANTPDKDLLISSVHDREKINCLPEIELADNAYGCEENRQRLATKGVDLVSPPTGKAPDGFGIMDFTLSEDKTRLLECPLGHKCLKNKLKTNKTTSYFDKKTCEACQHVDDCPVKLRRRKAIVTWQWKRPDLEIRRRMFEEDNQIISLYRQRSGIESTFSVLKRKFGLKQTRRRGFMSNSLAIIMAVIGLNVLRVHKWLSLKGDGKYSKDKRSHDLPIEIKWRYFLFWSQCVYNVSVQFGQKWTLKGVS